MKKIYAVANTMSLHQSRLRNRCAGLKKSPLIERASFARIGNINTCSYGI